MSAGGKPAIPSSIKVGVQPGTRVLRIERVEWRYYCQSGLVEEFGWWVLWLHTADFQTGTYLKLFDNGRLERVTLHAEGHEDIWLIKPEPDG